MMPAEPILPWCEPQWRRLMQQRAADRLPHALLLSGPAGVGKEGFAETLAGLLLCQRPGNDAPCGLCHGCELQAAGHHPDLVRVSPEAEGKPIRVDQVRELIEHLHSTAQQGGYRVVIMRPAESLNTSSANALLKILEEPGRNTVLLLISHQPGQLMPTIRSRCQRIDFAIPPAQQGERWLQQQFKLERERAAQLLRLCHGAPLKAQALYAGDLLEQRKKLMAGLADLLRGRMAASELAQQLLKADLLQCLDWLNSLLGDIVRIQLVEQQEPAVNGDMQRMLRAIAERAPTTRVFALADRIQEERVSLLLRQNPNRQLLLERLLLQWAALVR
jgi:DNA polymerase-3 subunit delta'